jgi:hypothetical protein
MSVSEERIGLVRSISRTEAEATAGFERAADRVDRYYGLASFRPGYMLLD